MDKACKSIRLSRFRGMIPTCATLLLLFVPAWGQANDAAGESAAGGLQLKSEPRISMVKERLYIGKKIIKDDPKELPQYVNRYPVVVEYEFFNESSEDVVTEVIFPLPEYAYPGENLIQDRHIHGFNVLVDGNMVDYATVALAIFDGKDVSKILRELKIDFEIFGKYDHWDPYGNNQIAALQIESRNKLKSLGIVDEELWPQWTVYINYHWTQKFPAGKIVKVRHEYNAIPGFSYSPYVNQYLDSLPDSCIDAGLRNALTTKQKKISDPNSVGAAMVFSEWVHYILTTANTWKTPIRDFELIVERPEGQYVSFCWDGTVEKISETKFRASAKNFIPKRELLVYFLSMKE